MDENAISDPADHRAAEARSSHEPHLTFLIGVEPTLAVLSSNHEPPARVPGRAIRLQTRTVRQGENADEATPDAVLPPLEKELPAGGESRESEAGTNSKFTAEVGLGHEGTL